MTMPDACKQPESREEMDGRSTRLLEFFNAVKGQPLGTFPDPVPAFTRWLNGRIREASRGDVTIEHQVRPEMANPTGLLHGGMQAAMLDDAVGMMTATLGHKGFLISIDMAIDYLGKVKVGETVLARARVVREGKTIVNAMAELLDASGQLVASARSNLLVTGHEPDFNKLA